MSDGTMIDERLAVAKANDETRATSAQFRPRIEKTIRNVPGTLDDHVGRYPTRSDVRRPSDFGPIRGDVLIRQSA